MAIIKDKSVKATKVTSKEIDFTTQLAEQQQALVEAKLGHKQGELTNTQALVKIRKQIARLKTAIRLGQLADKEEK